MNLTIPTPVSLLALLFLTSLGGVAELAAPPGAERISDADRAGLSAALASARREAVPTAFGFRLDHRPSQLSVGLDGRGLDLIAGRDVPTWGLELAGFGYAGAERKLVGEAEVHAAGNRVTYSWGADLDEWFLNGARGIEHGYTLRQRPEGQAAGAALAFDLDVRGDLVPAVDGDAHGVRFLDATGSAVVHYAGLTVFDAQGRTLAAHFEPRGDELRLAIEDTGATYPLTIDPMIQLAYLKPVDPDNFDTFGDTIAISGNTAVIGVVGDDSASTGAYGDETDNSSPESGAAYVFVRNGSAWTQQAFLKASNNDPGDRFGTSVAIDGDTIVVGAPFEMSSSTGVGGDQSDAGWYHAGAAYVFVRFGLTWGQEAYIKATNTEANDSFGYSVGVSGNLLVVGARYEGGGSAGIGGDQSDNSIWRSGAAYLYSRNGSAWSPQLYLKASNPGVDDNFGTYVAIEGTRIAVAAPQESSAATGINGNQLDNSAPGAGAVYIFEQKGELWVQDAYVKASNTDASDHFGSALALTGDTLAVGAEFESSAATGIDGDQADDSASSAGAAYVFVDDGLNWSQEAYIKASNTESGDFFGVSIAASGNRLVVGALYEDSAAIGIDGDQTDNSLSVPGAAYSFVRTAGVWSQEAYLKASNTESFDRFGSAVAVSGDTVLVGAPGEDGGQGGVNGDQSDNSAASSGAAYAFELSSPWGFTQYGPGTGANVADLNSYTAPLVNSFVTLELSEWNTSGVAFLLVSAGKAQLPILGGTLLVDSNLSFFGPGGVAYVAVPVDAGAYTAYLPPILSGMTIYAQAAMFDQSQPAGLAFTNGLAISIP